MWFRKKTIKSSEVIARMLRTALDKTNLSAERGTWNDANVPFDRYQREDSCLQAFAIFYAIIASKLPEETKRLLLGELENQVVTLMQSGQLDAAFYHDVHEYYDAFTQPPPPHLNPLWNVGLVFAQHCGAGKDVAYVTTGATFGKMLTETVKLLNWTSKSYRIAEG